MTSPATAAEPGSPQEATPEVGTLFLAAVMTALLAKTRKETMRPKYRFVGRVGNRYNWVSLDPPDRNVPYDHVTCPVQWFWGQISAPKKAALR